MNALKVASNSFSPTLISIRNLLRGLSLVCKLDVHGIEEIVVVGKPGEAVIAARANAGARDGDGSPRERVIELRDLGACPAWY